MPDTFTPAQVEAIAALAQLALEPSEVALFARQLGDFLAYAAEVQAIDTTGVPPTAHVASRPSVDRDDQVRESLTTDEALANAPDPAPAGGLFRVPRII